MTTGAYRRRSRRALDDRLRRFGIPHRTRTHASRQTSGCCSSTGTRLCTFHGSFSNAGQTREPSSASACAVPSRNIVMPSRPAVGSPGRCTRCPAVELVMTLVSRPWAARRSCTWLANRTESQTRSSPPAVQNPTSDAVYRDRRLADPVCEDPQTLLIQAAAGRRPASWGQPGVVVGRQRQRFAALGP
jgi:hypothetical protein